MKYFTFLMFLTLISLSSCKLIDPEELTPSYIYIDDIVLSTKTLEGTSSDNIIDAWVYVNGNNIGVYELPSKIPIHAKKGSYNLQIFPGIKRSGSSSDRLMNPFMTSFDTTMNSIPNHIDTITPKVKYETGTKIWIEDFEDPGIKFSKVSYSDTTIFITNNPNEVFEGNGSGKIQFEPSYLLFECKTNELSFNNFPKGGKPIYIELDYKSNEIISLGIYHNNSTSTLTKTNYYNLLPTNGKWKKTYIDIAPEVSSKLYATEFEIYIEVRKIKSSLPEVLIDNIKVMY